MGYYSEDIISNDMHITITYKPFKEARYMLLKKAFIEISQMHSWFKCPSTIIKSIIGWPRYKFVASPKNNLLYPEVVIVSIST